MDKILDAKDLLKLPQPRSWKNDLEQILHHNNHNNLNSRKASPATMKDRATFLKNAFQHLRNLGYTLEVVNLKQKHIQALCQHYEAKKLAPSTIRKYMAYLEAFCVWIGKGGMLHGWQNYFSVDYLDPVEPDLMTTRQQPQSTGFTEALTTLRGTDSYVWHQLMVQVAFNLKRKETMTLMPTMDVMDDKLHVISRNKGRSIHIIPIETPFQYKVIELAQVFVGGAVKNLCLPGRNSQQSIKHYSNVLHRVGLGKIKSDAMKNALETLVMDI